MHPPTGNEAIAAAITGAVAAVTFVVVNQIGFAIMIPLARGTARSRSSPSNP